MQFDLLVIGEINADLILRGTDVVPEFGQVEKLVDTGLLTIGSSSCITACGAARLGLRTALVGVVGGDELGSYLLSSLAARGVDVSGCITDAQASTGISVILSPRSAPDRRAILTAPGTIGALTVDQIDRALLARARHLHCGSYFLQPRLHHHLPDLFAQAHDLGLTCSLDTNWDPAGSWDRGVREVLTRTDIVFPNAAEACHLTGQEEVSSAVAELARSGATVVVKLGADGARMQRGERVLAARVPNVRAVDTVGAGDSFDAGYLCGQIQGWDEARSLALAVACGTLSTQAMGGTAAQPSLPQALELADGIKVRELARCNHAREATGA